MGVLLSCPELGIKDFNCVLQSTVDESDIGTDDDSTSQTYDEEEEAVPAAQPPAQQSTASTINNEVMRTKNFFLKPMTVEAAVEQCEQLGHDFYVFREYSSDQVQVVYKRRTVGYGVIVPVNEDD